MPQGTRLDVERLTKAVRDDAAIRRIRRLQPVGGAGDKIFPPTYPGERKTDSPRHVFERRRVDGRDVLCVLVDSVQSQANRLEEALRAGRDEKVFSFPAVTVDFKGTAVADIGRLTTMDVPHRVFDAIIRDSELKGTRFRDTADGGRLIQAKSGDARALFELSPTALLFGAWNSTGEGGGLGAKFPRAIVSEIVGIGVAVEPSGEPSGQRTGSRIDPLGIRSAVRVYKTPDGDWTLEKPKKDSKEAKEVRPSEVNHSNIAPTVSPLGVSVDYLLHSFVLSFRALGRLRFPGKQGGTGDADLAARTALAALGIAAAAYQDRAGYFLRSRCDLVPEVGAFAPFELVHADGTSEPVSIDLEAACALVKSAAGRAAESGIGWNKADVLLEPQAKLVELVRRSRERALQGAEDGDAEA